MHKLQYDLIKLLSDSLHRLDILFDKNTINISLKYDIYKTAFRSNIALKLRINAHDILNNINLNNSKKLFKEITINNNYIYFFLNNTSKYNILNNIFNQVINGIFGIGSNKQLIIDIQYHHQDIQSLSYYREKSYYQALINLYKICGYTVQVNNKYLTLADYMNVYNMIKSYIRQGTNIVYFQDRIFMCDNAFTTYAQYICNYITRYIEPNKKNITICAKPYTVKNLKYIDNILRFKYSKLFKTEPIFINTKSSDDIKYHTIDDINDFKFMCMKYKINQSYTYNNSELNNILKLYKQITNLIIEINNLSIINNHWYSDLNWRLFKTDEILFNHISQLNNMLNFASKEIKLHIVYNYLLKLCYLVKPVINSAIYILKHDNIDLIQLKSKLKLLIITKYIIKFIFDIFNIRCL